MIGPGSRVRYLFEDQMFGTVVRKSRGKGVGWIVDWDEGRLIMAAEENLEEVLGPQDHGVPLSPAAAAIEACRAVVDANDCGMTAEEGRRAVELCRAVIADEDAKGAR